MPGTALVIFERIEIVPTLFGEKAQVDDVLERIRREARAQKIDISTKEGRDACASLAYKIARSKTALDDMGKELVSGLKAQAGAVDAERRRIRESLDTLRDEIRAPLDRWEQKDKARIAKHEQNLEVIGLMPTTLSSIEPPVAEIDALLVQLNIFVKTNWEEFSDRATAAINESRTKLNAVRESRVRQIAQQEELARLRATEEQRQREEKARQEEAEKQRIADEAAAKARLAAETAAKAEQNRRDAEAKAEQQRLAEEARAAEKRAADETVAREAAERRAAEAEEKAMQDAIVAAEKAEADRLAAAEKAREEERQRQADEKRRQDEETRKREANRKHRATINNAVVQAIIQLNISEAQAKAIVTAIAKGEIPHTKISY